MEARIYQKLARKLVECEERSKLLKKMISEGVGFNEEEQFFIHERGKLRGKNDKFLRERRDILALIMGKKLRDNIYLEGDLRRKRDLARRKMEEVMGSNSSACRKGLVLFVGPRSDN